MTASPYITRETGDDVRAELDAGTYHPLAILHDVLVDLPVPAYLMLRDWNGGEVFECPESYTLRIGLVVGEWLMLVVYCVGSRKC